MISSKFAPRPWIIVLIFLLIYLGVIFIMHGNDTQIFVTLGSCFSHCSGNDGENCDVPENASPDEQLKIEGYDGQFNFYIARNPADAAPCIDVPAYRYQRILLPLLGYVLSAAGNTHLIPLVFVLINGLALVISTHLLEDLLGTTGRSIWFALVYGLFFGVVISVRLSTSEPLAYALVIGAIWTFQKEYRWLTPICLGLAGFAKETTGVFALGFLLWFIFRQRWRDALRLVLVAGVPFILWQIFLYFWLGTFGLGSGGAKATGFEIIPLAGWLKIWTEGSFLVFLLQGIILVGAAIIFPTLWGLYRTLRELYLQPAEVTLYTILLFTNTAIMLFVPFSTYREFLGILRFAPGLVLMVLLYSAERALHRPLRYSVLWIYLLAFLLAG